MLISKAQGTPPLPVLTGRKAPFLQHGSGYDPEKRLWVYVVRDCIILMPLTFYTADCVCVFFRSSTLLWASGGTVVFVLLVVLYTLVASWGRQDFYLRKRRIAIDAAAMFSIGLAEMGAATYSMQRQPKMYAYTMRDLLLFEGSVLVFSTIGYFASKIFAP